MAAPVVTKALRDTSVIIDATGLDAWRGIEPLISSVTLGELHAGVEQGDAMERATRRRRLLYVASTHRVLSYGADEAEAFGLLWRMVTELGRKPRSRALDLQIAATAMVHDLPLLTRNYRDLEGLERAVRVVPIGAE
ncbi:hypothetical protein BH10ACT7_BH10ACT7_01180 [soil metagenome]